MRRSLADRLSAPAIRFRALSLGSKIALVFFVIVVLGAIFAPQLAPYDPLKSGIPVRPPSLDNFFGTDRTGRDIFSRILFGARSSLVIGIGATVLALIAGSVLGSIAAVARPWISETIMRILDIVMSFPGIALAVVFVAVYGKSIPVLIGTIAFLYLPQLSRVVRANVLNQIGEDYVAAEKVMGARQWYVLIHHVARNCAAPVLVFATILVADAIVFEASLSFIGAGVQDPAPSWGNIISSGRNVLLNGAWWATFFPGMLILATVLALNILAEGMTDAMVNPGIQSKRERAVRTSAPASVQTPGAAVALSIEDVEAAVEPATESLPLVEYLRQLRITERARGDRLVYERDEFPLLDVQELSIRFPQRHGDVNIVDSVSFTVRPGETMALVGESGCGKSLTSLAIMGLLPKTAGVTGKIMFEGKNLLELSEAQRNALRGGDMSMVYQDALSSLNPSMLIKAQLNQLLRRGGTRTASEMLELVGLDPVRTLKSYPHELSGGQRQRVLIALALTREPKLVVADEPTTALDVTVQAQIIDLLNELREELGFAMVFVSHDLALVASLAHRVTVMYAGQVVETAPISSLLRRPQHEYTRGLLGAVLSIEHGATRLHQIPGTVPSPRDFITGDRFAPRSLYPDADHKTRPPLVAIPGTEHWYASSHPAGLPNDEIEGAG